MHVGLPHQCQCIMSWSGSPSCKISTDCHWEIYQRLLSSMWLVSIVLWVVYCGRLLSLSFFSGGRQGVAMTVCLCLSARNAFVSSAGGAKHSETHTHTHRRSGCHLWLHLFCSVFCPQWVACVDLAANDQADANVLVNMTESFTEQSSQVFTRFLLICANGTVSRFYSYTWKIIATPLQVTGDVSQLLGEQKVDAILCVAGGWAGGSAKAKGLTRLL